MPFWKRLIIISAALAVLVSPSAAAAATESPYPSDLAEDQAHLHGLESDVTSIADRIKQIESQTKEIQAKRAETAKEIAKLSEAARSLVPALQAKTADYELKREAFRQALAFDYAKRPDNEVQLLVEEGSLAEVFRRSAYRASLDSQIENIAHRSALAYDELRDQKVALDGQKSTLEVLKRQLDQLDQGLAAQQAEQQELLANRTNEAAYMAERIARAKAAEDAILSGGNAIWGTFTEGASVRQGDVIGLEGSTGFSTGCHTHFSVIRQGRWHDPEAFWSVLRHPDGSIVQPFGMTDYARSGAYHGGIHNGVDFVQGCGHAVRAAADGVIIRDNRTDGSGFGHYVMIRHGDGLITLYGHLI
jgi:septal ring factor EnvC (AmiA/AmiB activator)